jgi:predicted RNA-binding protein Jag
MELRTVEAGEDMSFDFVSTLISDIGLKAEAKLYAVEDGTRRITIEGEDAAVLIGHHGDTLDALQYLANLASARKNSKGERDKSRVTIDIEGYRKKREETLRALARRMANKAKRNRRSVMLEPMSAYERRIIHSEIQNIEGVSTNSIGSDNNRKIVIFLTDKKPEGIFEEKAPETPLVEEFAKDEMDNSSEVLGNLDAYTTADEIETDVTAVEATRAAEDIFEDDDFDVK